MIDKDLFDTLQDIFYNTKKRFKYTSDKVRWNMSEHWENYDQIPDTGYIYGDCDCFALACRKECRKLDIPSRLVFCKIKIEGKWVYHLVLECIGWVFDNNQYEIRSNQDLPYTWISMSGYERGDSWSKIKGAG